MKAKKRKYGEFSKDNSGIYGQFSKEEEKKKSARSFLRSRKTIDVVEPLFEEGLRVSRIEKSPQNKGAADNLSPVAKKRRVMPEMSSAKPAARRSTRVPPSEQMVPEVDEESEDDEAVGGLKNCLRGLTVVVTGVFQGITRDQVEATIKKFGARCTGSISGKTDYLVAGYKLEDGREASTSGKYRSAKAKGIAILDEEGFEKMIREKSGDNEYKLSTRDDLLKNIASPAKELRKSLTVGDDGATLLSTEMWTDLYRP